MNKAQHIIGGLVTAFRTLTILPVPGREAVRPADALPFFPLVGAFIGVAALMAAWIVAVKTGWTWGGAWAGVFALAVLTRGLHLDGLGDTVDAWLGGTDPARRLEIMKDPHIGAFGVAAIVLALSCKIAAIERLCSAGQWGWIALPVVLSRTVMVYAATSLPYARSEGGKARAFVEGARPAYFMAACCLAAPLAFLLGNWQGLLMLALVLAMAVLQAHWMRRVFGGVTGDLLGFAGEKAECALYLLLACLCI